MSACEPCLRALCGLTWFLMGVGVVIPISFWMPAHAESRSSIEPTLLSRSMPPPPSCTSPKVCGTMWMSDSTYSGGPRCETKSDSIACARSCVDLLASKALCHAELPSSKLPQSSWSGPQLYSTWSKPAMKCPRGSRTTVHSSGGFAPSISSASAFDASVLRPYTCIGLLSTFGWAASQRSIAPSKAPATSRWLCIVLCADLG